MPCLQFQKLALDAEQVACKIVHIASQFNDEFRVLPASERLWILTGCNQGVVQRRGGILQFGEKRLIQTIRGAGYVLRVPE